MLRQGFVRRFLEVHIQLLINVILHCHLREIHLIHLDYLSKELRKAFKILIDLGRLHLNIHNISRSAKNNSSQPTMAPSNNSRRASLSTSSIPLSHYGSLDQNCKIEELVNIPSKVSKFFYVCCKILRWYIKNEVLVVLKVSFVHL